MFSRTNAGSKSVNIIAAVYARVSTDKQREGISLPDQIDKMMDYAQKNNITVPSEYIFQEAFSGYKEERPELDQVRQLIRSGKIDVLIVYSSDRYTRDVVSGEVFRNELRRANVELHYVTKGQVDIYSAQGKLVNTIEDAFAAYWGQMIQQTTQEKKKAYIQSGVPFVQGLPPYGLSRVGKKGDAKVIFNEQAEIVKEIFDKFDNGWKAMEIADSLSLRSIPTAGDLRGRNAKKRPKGVWTWEMIYHILSNETYKGIHRANTTKTVDGVKNRVSEDDYVIIRIPQLIPDDLFDRVQEKLSVGRREKVRPHIKYDYLIARRCTCAHCKMHIAASTKPNVQTKTGVVNYSYYRCYAKAKKLGICDNLFYKVDEVDETVWQWIQKHLENPRLLTSLLEEVQEKQSDVNVDINTQIEDIDALIAEEEEELNNLTLNLAKMRNPSERFISTIETQSNQISQRIDNLRLKKIELESKLAEVAITEDDFEVIENFSCTIKGELEDAPFEKRREIVEALDLHFELGVEDGQEVVYIIWKMYEWKENILKDSIPSGRLSPRAG